MNAAKITALLLLSHFAAYWFTAICYEREVIEHGVAARVYEADGRRVFKWAEVKQSGRWVE